MMKRFSAIILVLLAGGALVVPAYGQDAAAPELVAVPPPPQAAVDPSAPMPTAPPMTASEQTVPPSTGQAAAPPAGDLVAALPPPGAPAATGMTPIEREISEQLASLPPKIDVNTMPSLFFSVWEHDLVLDARRGLTTRAPNTDDGLGAEAPPRDIALGGIVWHSGKDWTIWLNSVRVSPTAIPDEVLDLKVFKDYVELEWFDESTNQVFPIRLRPHQRFNLDSRIFLPG